MDRVLGQDHATASLQRALASGRVPHAWIFHGPSGVGKFTTALEFARILLDPEAAPDSSGARSSDQAGRVSRLIDGDRHPDLHIIRKELALDSTVARLRTQKMRNIPIDLLREHMIGGVTSDEQFHDARAFQSPQLGHGKVFIIDEAELMDQTGQNAILKTLEEPPPRTFIILITTHIDRLLPTIRSRCRPVAFTPLDDAAMDLWMQRHADELTVDGVEMDAPHRAWVRAFAAGSPGRALIAVRDGLYQWRQSLLPLLRSADSGTFDASFGPTLAGFVDAFATDWVKRHKQASKEAANRDGVQRVFLLLADHVDHRLRTALREGSDARPWLLMLDMLEENEAAITRNVNMKMVFENIAAQWVEIASAEAVA